MHNVYGYEDLFNQLIKNYKTNNLHSSLIFYGSKGVGKRTFINALILKILEINFKDNEYEHHTNLFINNVHPNIKIIEREFDNKTKKLKTSISIEQIRTVKKFINSTSSINKLNKFIIIDSSDELNLNSSNSLLKTLEEPNQNTYIFLISHQLSLLLPTIRSRCLKLKFSNHNFENFKKIIETNIENIKDTEIKFFYDISLGSPGNAILLYNEDLNDIFEMILENLSNNEINTSKIKFCNYLSNFDNEKFLNVLSLFKTILIFLNKLKSEVLTPENFLSLKFKSLNNVSKLLTKQNIIDRFEFIVKNEKDLFNYNLDKKLFMLKLLSH